MLVSSLAHCLSVLIFQLWGVQTFSPIPACPVSCVCEETFLINCASQGLPKAPSHIPATATALDLSHNDLHSLSPLGSGHVHLQGLQHLWVGNNSLESLSMCSGIQSIAGTRNLTRRKQRCVSWAPDLQSLSADRNQLKCLPRGLGNIKSLKVLQLSHNRISAIGRADLAGCTHLNELRLQYNLINTIHPEAFKDLQKLKVLDVSYNLLATIPVPAYLSLRNLNVLVDIFGNRWRCDCNLKTIRRWLSFDSELGKPAWEVVCFSPSHHAGKSLLFLEESDLACLQPVYSTPGLKKKVTVKEGMGFILSCSAANQDFMHTFWWTPQGQISDSQSFLHISNATERDAGLYVCISGYQEEHVSVFSLHVRKRSHDKRLRREAQIGSVELNSEDKDNIQRNAPSVRAVQQSHFALVVSLSVIITFIVAFVLGVVLRPFLDKCYKQIQNKRNSTPSPPNSQTSSTAQRPYVNEGYSDTDDQEQEVHEGPRVTFGGVTEIHEKGGVPYYVTVEGGRSGSNTDVAVLHKNTDRVLVENIDLHKDVPLREENKEMTSPISTESLNAESSKGMEFEYIPDPEDTIELEDKSISSASSLSGEQQESQMPYEAKESIEQSVDSPTVSKYEEEDEQASTGQQTTIPGFVTDPFPLNMYESKEESVEELDPDLWNDSGESFSFTEGSPRSSSRVSHVDAFGHPNIQKEMSVDEPCDRSSSLNSSKSEESEGGDTEYRVNPEDDEDLETQISYSENDDMNYDKNKLSVLEEDIHNENKKTGTGAQLRQDTITLDPTDIHMTYTRGDSFDDEQFTDYKERYPSSNSDYKDEPTQYHVHPVYRSSQKTTTPMEDVSGASRCIEENEDEQEYPSESDESHVSSYFDDSTFGKIDQALYPIPHVKRYLHFSQSQSYPPSQTPPCSTEEEEIIPTEVEKTDSKKFYSEDNFFAQSDASLDDLPKVKRYVQFSPSESQISSDSTSDDQVSSPVVVSKRESPSDTISISYEGQSVSLEAMPKVERYVQFRQSEPQTVHEPNIPAIKKRSFFGQIPISFDEVPKVKQYVQFSPSESQISSDSTPTASVNQVATPVVVSKPESPSDTISISYEGQSISLSAMPKVERYVQFRQSEPQTVIEHNITNIHRDSFFGQIPISFDEVPKVKQYVQFSPSESRISNDSTPTASVKQFATPVVVSKRESPSDTISISYEGQSTSLEAMPKVERYVQFRQSEPQTVLEPNIPAIKDASFFGQIPISCAEVPNVKQYVQFSPSESQISSDSTPKTSVSQVSSPVVVSKRESPSDSISISYEGQSTSLEAMPKVERYVQFRQSEPQTVHEPNIPAIKERSFFGQIPISCAEVPNVKQYVQFSPSESQISSDSTPTASVNQVATPVVVSKPESPSDTISISYEGQSISLSAMPKVERYVQFRQSEPQTVIEHNITNIHRDSFFGQIPISFAEVPKVERRILFSQLESHHQPSSEYRPSKKRYPLSEEQNTHEIKTTLVTTKPHSPGDFFVQIGAFLDGMPKVKRYMQFTQSEVFKTYNLPYFPLNLAVPTLQAGTEVKKNNSPFEDGYPVVDEDSFFGQIGVFFDGIPKVRRRIQFTERLSQPPVSQSPSNYIQPAAAEHSFFVPIGASSEIPKVRRYIQFSQSSSQPSSQYLDRQTARPVLTKPELISSSSSLADSKTNKEDTFFKKMDVSELPKVNRYIEFTKQHSKSSKSLNTFGVTDYVVKKTDLRGLELSRVDVKPLLTEDSFFARIETNLNSPPRVNRYIQFTQSEPYSSQQSQSPTEKMTEKERKTLSSTVDNDDALFDGIFESLNKIPKVKKRLLFTQSTYQNSNLTEVPQKVTPQLVTKTESVRPSSLPDKEVLSKKRDNFVGQLGVSVYEVPKVKKYITFSQSKAYPPTLSSKNIKDQSDIPFFKTEIVTPVLVTKTESGSIDSSFEKKQKTVMKEDTFSAQTGMPFDEVPKVKRYIQFTQTEPQPSAQYLSTKLQTRGSEDKETPTIKVDDFFGQTGSTFDELPRVKRHIQFKRAEPRLQPPILHSLSNRTEKSIQTRTELKMKDLASEDYVAPAAGEHNFFGPIGTSYEIPKLKRYIRFSQSSTQPSSQHLNRQTDRPVLTKPELWTSLADSKSNNEDTFFKKKDVSELPKVNRYVQFTQQHSTPQKSLNTHGVTDEKTGLWGSDLSKVEITPPVTEDSFLGHLGTNLNSLPRVNRYIQIRQSEPYPSSQSQSSTEKMAKNASIFTQSEYQNKTAANDKSRNTADTVFGSLDLSFIQLPKEKRHVYSMQSEPHRSSEGGFKLTTKKNEYFGQTDGVPRLIRYRQFRQSESLTQTSSPSISSQKWKTMDVESTDSKMFKTNLTSGTARDLSQIQDAPSGMKVSTETGRLHQLPEPKRSLYSSTPDVYGQPDHVFIEEEEEEEEEEDEEEVFRHTRSLSDDTKYVNTHGSSGRTALSTTESRTILESKLSSLHASSNESAGLPTRKLVIDPALQDVFQSSPDEPGASPGKDDAREYLRDSSLARQRQERRRLLFQQKRRAMDGFSESFNSQESD